MNHSRFLGFTFSFLLISLAGFGIAEETPSKIIYIQGGVSSVTGSTNGTTEMTVKDVIPYFYIGSGDQSSLIQNNALTYITNPLSAVLVFSENDGVSTSFVKISNLSYSTEDKTLMLEVTSNPYYDGEILKSFAVKPIAFDPDSISQFNQTQIYTESPVSVPLNSESCECADGWHVAHSVVDGHLLCEYGMMGSYGWHLDSCR